MKNFSWSTLNYSSVLDDKDSISSGFDLVCLSQSPRAFVYQRSQHLLSQYGQTRRFFFIEEPVVEFIASWWLEIRQPERDVWVVVPHLPNWVSDELTTAMRQSLMGELFDQYAIANPILWYGTPTALAFTNHLRSSMIVYDRMDEPSASQNSSPDLEKLERQLLQRADVVFKSEKELVEAKQGLLPKTKALSAYEIQLEALNAQPAAGV